MPECSLVPNPIPCFLTFCSIIEFNPYLPLKFNFFYHSSALYQFLACLNVTPLPTLGDISMFTLLLTCLTFQFPSYRGIDLPALGYPNKIIVAVL